MNATSKNMLKLGELLEEFDERLGSRPEPEILTLTEKMGFVSQRERFNKRLAISDTSNYKVIGLYDIAFNPYLLWANAIAQNTSWKTAIISPLYPTFHVRDGYSQRFVNYLLCGGFLISYYDNISHGSVPRKRRASVSDFMNLKIPMFIPSFVEQERIVKLLDESDELRKLRSEADGRTTALISSIFNEMFGDQAANSRSWPTKPLGELAEVIRGVSFDKSQVFDAPGQKLVPILRAGNIQYSLLTNFDLIYIPSDLVNQEQRMRQGDLAVCMSSGSPAIVGKSAHLETEWDGAVGAFCAIVRFKEGLNYLFGSYWFRSPGFMQWRDDNAKGANIQNLRIGEMKKMTITVPPLLLQKEFAVRASEIRSIQAEQAASRKRLDDLFKSMLHRAFNGEL